MAFNESGPLPRKIWDTGIRGGGSSAAGNGWLYRSSDANAAVTATGYLAGCGVGSKSGPQIGMAIGDVVLCVESSAGASPGKLTMHTVTASTAAISNASPLPSSAFHQRFNASLSTGT